MSMSKDEIFTNVQMVLVEAIQGQEGGARCSRVATQPSDWPAWAN